VAEPNGNRANEHQYTHRRVGSETILSKMLAGRIARILRYGRRNGGALSRNGNCRYTFNYQKQLPAVAPPLNGTKFAER
jgi:hypothetical protein